MLSAPKKINSRGYEACSKKDGLVESSVTDCWSMSPSNVTSNTASKSNWRWPDARTGTGRTKIIYSFHHAELVVRSTQYLILSKFFNCDFTTTTNQNSLSFLPRNHTGISSTHGESVCEVSCCMCKGKEIAYQLPFLVINTFWPWPFWPQNQ